MKVRDNNKCKEWERRRRDRLTDSFKSLVELLPNYDPAKIPPKIDILDNSTQFIKELRLSNSRLLSIQTQPTELTSKINHLQDEVNKLILRVKQLTALLVKAKIPIPTGPSIKSLGKKRLKWTNKLKVQNKRENMHIEQMCASNHRDLGNRKKKTTITVIESLPDVKEKNKETFVLQSSASANSTSSGKKDMSNGNDLHQPQGHIPPTPTLTIQPPTFFLAPIQTQAQQFFRLHISPSSVQLLPKVCLQSSLLQKIPIRPITRPRLPKPKKKRQKAKVKTKKGKTESGTQTSHDEEDVTKIANTEIVNANEETTSVTGSESSIAPCLPVEEEKVNGTSHVQVSLEFESSEETVGVEITEGRNECQILKTEFLVTEHDENEASEKEKEKEVEVEGRSLTIGHESTEDKVDPREESMELSPTQSMSNTVNEETIEKNMTIVLEVTSTSEKEVYTLTESRDEKAMSLVEELPEIISNIPISNNILSEKRSEEIIQRSERKDGHSFEVNCENVSRDVNILPPVEDKISECIARSIGLIEATSEETETELMELGTDWDVGETHSHSSKSPISPTQMFLSMFPLLPRESLAETQTQATPSTQRSLEQKQQSSSRSSFFIDAMLPEETPSSNYETNMSYGNSLGVIPIAQQRPINQSTGDELKRHSADSLDSILAPLQTLKDRRHTDILSLSAFLNIHDPPESMKDSTQEKRQEAETGSKKPILTPLQTVQSTQVHQFQSFSNQSQQDPYHHKDPFSLTTTQFLNTFSETSFHNSFSPPPVSSTPSRNTMTTPLINSNYTFSGNYESNKIGERRSRKEGKKTSKNPQPPRQMYPQTTGMSTGRQKTPPREQKERSDKGTYQVRSENVEGMKSNHLNYTYGQTPKSNGIQNNSLVLNTHLTSTAAPPITQGQHLYAQDPPQVNVYSTEQNFNHSTTSTRTPFYTTHGGSKSTPFYLPTQLDPRNLGGNGEGQGSTQVFTQRPESSIHPNTHFGQMPYYDMRSGKKELSNAHYGLGGQGQPSPQQQYSQTHFRPPLPPPQTQRFPTQHSVPMETTSQPKKQMQGFSSQTQSRTQTPSTSQGPVNWMTDSPYKKTNQPSTQENLFSVSKLVGVGNSNNYCAEALIRHKRNPWDDFPSLHHQSTHPHYQTHLHQHHQQHTQTIPHTTTHDRTQHDITQHDRTQHDRVQHDRVQHDRVQHDRTQHERTQHDRTQHDRSQHYTPFPQSHTQEQDFGRSYQFDVVTDPQPQQTPFVEQDYPQHHTTPSHSTQFSNFNLSSIFPEINDKTHNSGPHGNAQPQHPPPTYYSLPTPRK